MGSRDSDKKDLKKTKKSLSDITKEYYLGNKITGITSDIYIKFSNIPSYSYEDMSWSYIYLEMNYTTPYYCDKWVIRLSEDKKYIGIYCLKCKKIALAWASNEKVYSPGKVFQKHCSNCDTSFSDEVLNAFQMEKLNIEF